MANAGLRQFLGHNSTMIIPHLSSTSGLGLGGTMEPYTPFVTTHTRRIITIVNHTMLGIPMNLVGCIGNIINVIVFLKMGFKDSTNISLFGLAVADFISLITLQWLNICATPWFQYSDIPFESFEVQYLTGGWPHTSMTRVTALLTAYIAFERCLCVTMPLKVKTILTPQRTTVFVFGTFLLLVVSTIPIYTVNSFGLKFYPSRNRSLIGTIFSPNKVAVEAVAFSLNNVYGYVAFLCVIICSALLIKTLKAQSRWREEQSNAVNKADAGKKERKTAVMVTTISVIFIVCYFPITLFYIAVMLEPELSLIGKYQNLAHALVTFGFLFECINSSVNIFIYIRMNTKFRTTLCTLFNIK